VIVVPGQQRHQRGQRGEEPGRHRAQLPDVTEGEGPQERAQCGRCFHPGEHLVHGAFPQHPEIGDAVGAGEHPGDYGADLRSCVAAGTSGQRQLRGHPRTQAGPAGQAHHRDQPGGADQVGFVEGRDGLWDLG
jgi:hypothetical protein